MKPKAKTIYEFFSNNKHAWIQSHYATNEAGEVCDLGDTSACCFCLSGAVLYIYGGDMSAMLHADRRIHDVLRHEYGYTRHYIGWNDLPGRTVDEVIELARKAGV